MFPLLVTLSIFSFISTIFTLLIFLKFKNSKSDQNLKIYIEKVDKIDQILSPLRDQIDNFEIKFDKNRENFTYIKEDFEKKSVELKNNFDKNIDNLDRSNREFFEKILNLIKDSSQVIETKNVERFSEIRSKFDIMIGSVEQKVLKEIEFNKKQYNDNSLKLLEKIDIVENRINDKFIAQNDQFGLKFENFGSELLNNIEKQFYNIGDKITESGVKLQDRVLSFQNILIDKNSSFQNDILGIVEGVNGKIEDLKQRTDTLFIENFNNLKNNISENFTNFYKEIQKQIGSEFNQLRDQQKDSDLTLFDKFSNFEKVVQRALANNNETLLIKFNNLERGIIKKLNDFDIDLKSSFSTFKDNITYNLNKNSNSLIDSFISFESKVEKQFSIFNRSFDQQFSTNFTNFDKSQQKNMVSLFDKFTILKESLVKELNSFREGVRDNVSKDFDKLTLTVEKRLDSINSRVEEHLKSGFNETTKTFNSILERLGKIDEAQRKIDSLSSEIISLQDVLTDKKSRGIFGEVQLNQILTSIFGSTKSKLFDIQYKLPNGYIADAILFAPEPIGNIVIDSKFPLENYKKMFNEDLNDYTRKEGKRLFKLNIKKHIDDIAKKYIVPNKTSQQAIMFLPAEAIFAEIHGNHDDLIQYSQKKRVWIASPTTLMAMLTTIQVVLRNAEREKYASIIQMELTRLGEEFVRYKKRWDSLSKHIDKVQSDVRDIHITTGKIERKFNTISEVNLDRKSIE